MGQCARVDIEPWTDVMAGSVNKVILVGNLGRDPEVRSMQDGGKIVQLSIAAIAASAVSGPSGTGW
jgi:hypothetical protein